MNELEKRKLQCLIKELIYMQLRDNYVDVDYSISLNAKSSWYSPYLDEEGFYYLERETAEYHCSGYQCICGYFKSIVRSDNCHYPVCTCMEVDELPPKNCPVCIDLMRIKIDKWMRLHYEDIKAYLADEMPKLIYITKNPTERNSGFGKQLFNNLSRDTFQHFLTTDKTFQTLCNQLTPSLY